MHINDSDNKQRKDSMGVKFHNRKLIIFSILKHGLMSRTQLTQLLGITKGGLSPIINSMLEEGILVEAGVKNTGLGRKPKLLKLNENHMNALTVNWARSFYEIGLVNIGGQVIDYHHKDIEEGTDLKDLLAEFNTTLNFMREKHNSLNIVGIGVAAPGPIKLSTKTILKPPYFNDYSYIKVDQSIGVDLGLPLYLDNDADARAIAEKYFGIGKRFMDFVHITVMEGIGAGIVINGNHSRNDNSFAGEFGHITIDYNGRECGCGNKGCIEAYSSIRAIEEDISNKLNRDVSWDEIVSMIEEKDTICLEIVKSSINYLGNGLVSFINMFQPKSVVIGGMLTDLGEDIIINIIEEVLWERSIFRNYYLPKIYLSKVKNDCIRGSAMGVFEKVLTHKNM